MDNESNFDIAKVIANNKPKVIIVAVVAVLVITAGIGFWFWSKSRQASSTSSSQKQEAPSLGDQIFEKTQNQLRGKVPDVNPFKDQKNPLDAIYKNPFK